MRLHREKHQEKLRSRSRKRKVLITERIIRHRKRRHLQRLKDVYLRRGFVDSTRQRCVGGRGGGWNGGDRGWRGGRRRCAERGDASDPSAAAGVWQLVCWSPRVHTNVGVKAANSAAAREAAVQDAVQSHRACVCLCVCARAHAGAFY